MRVTRAIVLLLSAALLGVIPLALTAPASAAAHGTTTTATASQKAVEFGTAVSISGNVTASNGNGGYGTAVLQVLTSKSQTWTEVERATTYGSFYFYPVKPKLNSAYRVVFVGGTSGSNSYTDSASSNVAVGVARKLVVQNPRGTLIKGKVSPDYKRKKVLIHKRVGKKWRKYRVLRTNKRARFAITLPAYRTRTSWRIRVPGNRDFLSAQQIGTTIRY